MIVPAGRWRSRTMAFGNIIRSSQALLRFLQLLVSTLRATGPSKCGAAHESLWQGLVENPHSLSQNARSSVGPFAAAVTAAVSAAIASI